MNSKMKQSIISKAQQKFRYKYFIETGTYLGQMVESQKENFEVIYTIELGEQLFRDANEKFKSFNHIITLQGDSGVVLNSVLSNLESSAIFWLDGHYSGGITAKGDLVCPIFNELNCIFSSKRMNHILFIDDERLFDGTDGYPQKKEVIDFIKIKNPKSKIKSRFDMIQVELVW